MDEFEKHRVILTINNNKKISDVILTRKDGVLYGEAWCHAALSCRGTHDAAYFVLPDDADSMARAGIHGV